MALKLSEPIALKLVEYAWQLSNDSVGLMNKSNSAARIDQFKSGLKGLYAAYRAADEDIVDA
jgi:hypothetical protein